MPPHRSEDSGEFVLVDLRPGDAESVSQSRRDCPFGFNEQRLSLLKRLLSYSLRLMGASPSAGLETKVEGPAAASTRANRPAPTPATIPTSRGTAWLTPEDIAKELRISRKMVYQFIRTGEIAAYQIGSRIRIKPKDFEKFLESRRKRC